MSTPTEELNDPKYTEAGKRDRNSADNSPSDDGTFIGEGPAEPNETNESNEPNRNYLNIDTIDVPPPPLRVEPSPSQAREQAKRLEDDLALLEAERTAAASASQLDEGGSGRSTSMNRSRSHKSEPIDEFDAATNPLHETAARYTPPENPTTNFAKFFIKVHQSNLFVRYFTYIVPVVLLLLIPLLVGALRFKTANVGGVELVWFSVWLEIVWLTLWAGRIAAKCLPGPIGIISTIFTNNSKKWRDLGKSLELPATLFFWWLGVEISFLPTMKNHHIDGNTTTRGWEITVNKIIVSIFVGTILNFIEKIIIQLIAISFHLRTYADRIEINKFQIGSLTKLYAYSKQIIAMEDTEFEQHDEKKSGVRTPLKYASKAQKAARGALNKVGDVAGGVVGDFTGKKVNNSSHPHQVILALLSTTSGSQVLARRLYRTFVREGFDTVFSGDLKSAFDNSEEAEAAFAMFDKDMNGDISMEELEAVCVEIGRERKSITASLKDLDSVVSKLDDVFFFIVLVITILVFLSLISTSAAGVLTSAGSTILALSWLFSATAQEFLQSVIFVFVKHPFDVGDRVTIYGSTGATLTGDDYFVKEIALLYTEFKKMEGHVVQAPNSYLNTLFILNQRRSGGLAEAVPITIKFGTTLEQIDALRQRLLEFVRSEKREYQGNILTELRTVTENFSITLNVVFFYKSNWQNELLRLQRRNKFICMLMVSLQEIGIEGPRMNLSGYRVDMPVHVTHHNAPPTYSAATQGSLPPGSAGSDFNSPSAVHPGNPPGSSGSIRPSHSILRKGSDVAAARARGEAISPHKHVDFSLGMQNVAAEDLMGDVYSDRGNSKYNEIVRSTNRESAERRLQEVREEEDRQRSLSRQRSILSNQSGPHAAGGIEARESVDAGSRTSFSSSVRRNRFFHRQPQAVEHEDLMEQGRVEQPEHIDPRTGTVSRAAVRDDSVSAASHQY
ncbi:hypothetical protein DTO021C3_5922 [Paecilomyces variotii]|nr:hypothetical protein DTO169C6_2823 [Paecilomyces variotii]KAJ9286574.1 hypothetical protein DTO021C3_5922 [Paecilomyces variotii]KAJ9401856.1 hypothetical protein DTO282F9_1146 [Paecilomyces variotii]